MEFYQHPVGFSSCFVGIFLSKQGLTGNLLDKAKRLL
jgi:hypothetical protein